MLMDLDQRERYEFIERVTRDRRERFRVTQPGDPVMQERLKRLLPAAYTNHALVERSAEVA